jgi:protein TonB
MPNQEPAIEPSRETKDTRIVEEVFGRPDRTGRHRWGVAALAVLGIYGAVFGALPFFAAPSLQEWASQLAARVHAELGRDREVILEATPPPPPAEPLPPPVARAVAKAPAVHAKAPSLKAPAPATSATVVARAAAGPIDLTASTFVTGTAATYAGGATTSSGTNKNAVEGTIVDPEGNQTGAAKGRPVRLDEADWSCPWPREADSAEINEQVVLLRVAVEPEGGVQSVKILADPGFGFGQAARTCALRTRFKPAQDEAGTPIFAWSSPIRVRFLR